MGRIPPCDRPCSLFIHCKVAIDMEPLIHETRERLDRVKSSTSPIPDGVSPELLEMYHAWVERMEIKFAGDPEGLSRALEAIGDLLGSTLDGSAQAARLASKHAEYLMAEAAEQAEKERITHEFFDAMPDAGCTGSTARRPFPWIKSEEVCNAPVPDELKRRVTVLYERFLREFAQYIG